MRSYKTFISTLSIFIIILFACSPSPTDLTKRYAKTYNTHNVKEIVSLYDDDAVFEVVGQFTLAGKEQIHNITKYDSVLNIQMNISDIKTHGDTVICNLTETNDWLKTAEIGKANYKVKFIFQNGLIKHLYAEAKPEIQQLFSQVLSSLMTWASENKADVLKEMMPEGRFIYNAENAKKTLALLRSWKDSSN